MQYVVAWRCRLTVQTGRGIATLSKQDAERECSYLNDRYPHIDHWPEPLSPNQPQRPPCSPNAPAR